MKRLISLVLLLPTLACASRPETVYENSKDKVVKIGLVLSDGREGTCSGSFVDSLGTVLTCAHCLSHEGITKVYIKRENGEVKQAVAAVLDKKHDLALLVTMFNHTPYFHLGKQVKMGQEVLAFGAPLGAQHTMSVGYVENLGKDVLSYIVHSAFILPGSSGGPLVNLKGELIGVNEATIMLNFLVPAAGYYVAIDVSEVRTLLGVK